MMDKTVISTSNGSVKMEFLINNRIKAFSAVSSNRLKGVIIYCHCLGSNKNWALRFCDKLLDHGLGLVAFDFPGHGSDNTSFKQFDLNLCVDYLNQVISYVESQFNVSVYLFGCSFGGFVILNRLLEKNDDIRSTILMCPAINFCEIVERKTGVSIDCFSTNEYLNLYNNIDIYKSVYEQFKSGDLGIRNSRFSDVSIIQGTLDKTVFYNDIENFCALNCLNLSVIENGKHELYGYDEEIVDFILSVINGE